MSSNPLLTIGALVLCVSVAEILIYLYERKLNSKIAVLFSTGRPPKLSIENKLFLLTMVPFAGFIAVFVFTVKDGLEEGNALVYILSMFIATGYGGYFYNRLDRLPDKTDSFAKNLSQRIVTSRDDEKIFESINNLLKQETKFYIQLGISIMKRWGSPQVLEIIEAAVETKRENSASEYSDYFLSKLKGRFEFDPDEGPFPNREDYSQVDEMKLVAFYKFVARVYSPQNLDCKKWVWLTQSFEFWKNRYLTAVSKDANTQTIFHKRWEALFSSWENFMQVQGFLILENQNGYCLAHRHFLKEAGINPFHFKTCSECKNFDSWLPVNKVVGVASKTKIEPFVLGNLYLEMWDIKFNKVNPAFVNEIMIYSDINADQALDGIIKYLYDFHPRPLPPITIEAWDQLTPNSKNLYNAYEIERNVAEGNSSSS